MAGDSVTALSTATGCVSVGASSLLPLAETAWAADSSTPEEDEAWRDS